MKIFRVHMRLHGASMGYQFYTSLPHATAFAKSYREDNKDDDGECVVTMREVDLTQKGVMHILQQWARHANNDGP